MELIVQPTFLILERGFTVEIKYPPLQVEPQFSRKLDKYDFHSLKNVRELKQAQREGLHVSVGEEQLIKAIDRVNKAIEGTGTTLEFSIHEKTKEIMVKVLNKDNGEVIREIPSEKTLDFVAKLREATGFLIDQRR
jgi:flagellar protein FlaG